MLHQIGVGALGPVFRTYEPERDRLVAVKAFRLDLTPEQARAFADELSRVAEAGLFHPSIVEPLGAGMEGTVAYSAEEYVAAESLDVAMRHYAPAAIDTVLPFITQLAGAIDFARAAGVGHGALHPRDVFVTPDEARLTGFGVVEALERVGFRAPVRRPYSAPERIAREPWSTAADVFALAAITYELLTARRPAGLGVEVGAIAPGGRDASSRALERVLARAMDADPSKRHETALSFVSDLEEAAHSPAATSDVSAVAIASGDLSSSVEPEVDWPVEPMSVAAAAHQETGAQAAHEDATVTGEEGEPEGDVVVERDEDEAHHQLTVREYNEIAAREAAVEHARAEGMDEDSEAEAEADRYAADDFLLDAAGAASVSERDALDDFRAVPDSARWRDDVAGESAAPIEPEAPRFRRDEPAADQMPRERAPRVPATPVVPPTFGHSDDVSAAAPARPAPRLAAIVVLVGMGLLVGLAGGYVLWGGSASPGESEGREFSEQTVAPAGTSPSTQPQTPSIQSAPGATAAPTTGPSNAPSGSGSTAPVVPESAREEPPRSSSPAATAPRRAPARAPSGTITVRSTPSGAGVTVNGRWRGRTPLAVEDLPFASYEVRVVQPGFVPSRQSVRLSSADPDGTVNVRLQPDARGRSAGRPEPSRPAPGSTTTAYTGSIFIDSRPRGAKVFIDSKEVGTTPLSVPEVPIGSHVVRLELPDHRIWTSTARVAAGQQARVTGSLERIQ